METARGDDVVRKWRVRDGIAHDGGLAGEVASGLGDGWDAGEACLLAPDSQAFVVGEEERSVLADGASGTFAELIIAEDGLRCGEEVARVELVIA